MYITLSTNVHKYQDRKVLHCLLSEVWTCQV